MGGIKNLNAVSRFGFSGPLSFAEICDVGEAWTCRNTTCKKRFLSVEVCCCVNRARRVFLESREAALGWGRGEGRPRIKMSFTIPKA